MSKCPHCKGSEFTELTVSSTDGYVSLVHPLAGRVNPRVCMDCGILFLSELELKRIKLRINRR